MDITDSINEIFESINVFGLLDSKASKIELDSMQFAVVIIEIEDRFQISLSQDEMLFLRSASFFDFEQVIARKITES